jgi:hypothetical protein
LEPAFVAASERALDLSAMLDRIAESAAPERKAFVELNNNAANDWLDLVVDCLSGRGRTALRAARSLFEISLVAGDLVSTPALAERFLDHKTIVAAHFVNLDADISMRAGKDRKAAEHARRKARRQWEPAARAFEVKYGAAFARSWDTSTVYDRAAAAGRLDEYEAYRVASATVHAGSGALFGTLLDYPDERPVHRMGPNLMICPLALLYGAKSFRQYLETVLAAGVEAAAVVIVAVDQLMEQWTRYERAMYRIDSWIWPDEAPGHHVLVAVVQPSDVYTMYLHDRDTELVIRARPAANSEWAHARLAEQVQMLREQHPNRTVPQSVLVAGAKGVPIAGSEWQNAGEVLPDAASTQLPVPPNSYVIFEGRRLFVDEHGVPRVVDDNMSA